MSDIKSLLSETANPMVQLMTQTRGLVNKWEKTGLLEGIKSDMDKSHMSILLENQAKQLIDEATRTGTTSNSEQWAGVALPLVRRVFAEIAAKEFVSVQPMNLPSGLVFYLDFKYGTTQAGKPSFASASLFGGNSTKLGSTDSATNGLYGAGRFGYSINDQSVTAYFTASVATPQQTNFDSTLSASVYAGTKIYAFAVSLGAVAPAFDANGVRAFVISSPSSGSLADFYPSMTSVNGNIVTFIVSSSLNVTSATGSCTIQYHNQPSDTSRGDFEDNLGTAAAGTSGLNADVGIPEVNLELKSEAIVAKTRKLKAVWTPELAQDLNAYHSIDAEAELTALLSEYVSMEIDLEILDMLVVNAATTDFWSANIGDEYNASTRTFSTAATNRTAYVKSTWFQTLGNKIQKVSNKIHQLTLRGGANFLVVSPDVATIIESIPGFTTNTDGDQAKFAMGVAKVGALSNRWTVYKNPYMTDNVILLGFRGNNFLETGAVYAPYIPLIQTPLVYDPVNFTPRRGVMTRYAKKMLRPEFYGRIVIDAMDKV